MIRYSISIPNPSDHFIHIEMKTDKIKGASTAFYLPAWRPGRYEMGNFSKNIRGWKAFDEKGKEVNFKKITKDCWHVESRGVKSLTIRYQYYANVLNAGSCWLDKEQLYINGIHCFLYIKDRMEEIHEISLNIPTGWKIACGLKEKKKHVLTANSYHELVDGPFVASGNLKHQKYVVGGVPFHIWIQGTCRPDWEKILNDFKRFSEEQLNLFGSFPAEDFHFIIQVLPYSFYHGVEHGNSTVLAIGPGYDLMKGDIYHELTGVACHELFHAWNVKTIRPAEMLPYHYQQENYSRLGYIYEGVTTYYGDYLLGRCGVYSNEQVLAELGKRLQSHLDNAGRLNYAVSESSLDTWLDGYVPGIPGRKTSIYDEGCLIAFMLDLKIRNDTEGKKSLDDFMILLNTNFGNLKRGYTEADLLKILKIVTGRDYSLFFENYVNRAVSLEKELKNLLQLIGCDVILKENPVFTENYFGFKTIQDGAVTRVSKVYPGSMADQSGLFADDEVMAVNGFRVENNLQAWCEFFKEEKILLDIFSHQSNKKISLKTGSDRYYPVCSIQQAEKTEPRAVLFFEKWLGC